MCTTPDMRLCGSGPPSPSMSISSPVTVRTTSGPVTKRRPAVDMMMMSVSAGPCCCASCRAQHHGDLRDAAGGSGNRREYPPDAVHGLNTVGEPGPAGMPQTNHGAAIPHGRVDCHNDAVAVPSGKSAAHDRRVRAEGKYSGTAYPANGSLNASAVADVNQLHRTGVE